jgi:hypothetical protein
MRVQVIEEVKASEIGEKCQNKYDLCLQWCLYVYDDGTSENGYRFIWRRPNGSLQPARGQARIPSLELAEKLIKEARSRGWGDRNGGC